MSIIVLILISLLYTDYMITISMLFDKTEWPLFEAKTNKEKMCSPYIWVWLKPLLYRYRMECFSVDILYYL